MQEIETLKEFLLFERVTVQLIFDKTNQFPVHSDHVRPYEANV